MNNGAPLHLVIGASIRDTFEEARARWLFWGLFGFSSLIILLFLFALNIDIVEGARATFQFGPSKTKQIWDIHKFVIVTYAWVASILYFVCTLIALFASAGLIPVLLEQGRIGLLLSKPVSRMWIIAGRYIGNILIISLNSTYLVGAVWLILAFKTRIWDPHFLIAIPCSIFIFAVLLSLVVLAGVLFESAALSIMAAVAGLIANSLLSQREWADRLLTSDFSRALWTVLYWIVPKVSDLAVVMHKFVLGESPGEWQPQLWSSAAFAAVMLAIALVVFEKRDY